MAKVNPSRTCARCQRAVKPGDDYVRACRWTQSAVFHWHCWLKLVEQKAQREERKAS